MRKERSVWVCFREENIKTTGRIKGQHRLFRLRKGEIEGGKERRKKRVCLTENKIEKIQGITII